MKKKVWDITVKDNPNRVVMGENDEFYTTDTEAYLVFNLDDENFNPATAVLTLENRNDGSLKNETVDVVDGLIEWEMPQRYIEHFGNWQGQLVYEDTKDGQPELYTSATFSFVVNAHIGDKKQPSLVEIENWEKFIRDGTELIETWEDMEDLRQANEAQRQANYQELLDTGVLQTNINTKLGALEEEYAPRLTNLEQNKADKGDVGGIENLDSGHIVDALGYMPISATDVPDPTWANLQNKPTEFNPTSHIHSINDVTGLRAELDSVPELTKENVGLGNVDNVKQASKVEHDQLATEFSEHQTEVTAELAHTTETLAGIDRTFGDRTFSTVSELQTAFPTGDTKRYVVASDGKWYWWNGTAWTAGQVAQAIGIADKSITPSKTNFFEESNLFNPETVNVGFVSSGTVYANPTYYHSDYIPVKPGETILISGNSPSVGECYDDTRTFVSNIGREVDADPNYTEFTIPDGVSYVRVNGFLGVFEDFITTPVENFMVVKGTTFPNEYREYNNGFPYIKDSFLKLNLPDVTPPINPPDVTPPINPLAGKILVNDGDSITEGSNPSGGFFKSYGELVADRYDMTFHNLGMGGSTLSNVAGNNPFTERWTNLPETLDYLTLWFGWNDQAYSTLGSIDDTVDTTFYGAWNTVLPELIKKYPKAKIGLIVPYLPSGKEAWQQAVRDVGAKWGIPVLDLADKDTPLIWLRDGVDPVIGQLRRSTFTYDGTHLNQDGHKYMSTFYEHFLLSL